MFVGVYGYIKVWVSCKIQSRFQQKMCLVYHTVITAFCESYHKIDAPILRRSVLQI